MQANKETNSESRGEKARSMEQGANTRQTTVILSGWLCEFLLRKEEV